MKQLFLWGMIAMFLISCNNEKSAAENADESAATSTTTTAGKMPAEIVAESKYIDMGKNAIAALSGGDIDGWMKDYADNAVYAWNNGDSIVGKPAITAYWKKRRTEVIDSITFHDAIFLPVRVNQPQSIEAPGVWLMSWYRVNVKYKSGNTMSQWIHTDMHFDANDKVDRVIQYLDRSVISKSEK